MGVVIYKRLFVLSSVRAWRDSSGSLCCRGTVNSVPLTHAEAFNLTLCVVLLTSQPVVAMVIGFVVY